MKKLPVGISTFSEIIGNDYYYVDKTPMIHRLVSEGKYYFLARPRRFGKSLLLDTIKQAFSGNKDLFKGLYLEKNWDWKTQFPVIHISFGAGVIENRKELDKRLDNFLKFHAEDHSLQLKYDTLADRFRELIRLLSRKYNRQVVVLVDEYDKPILDNIANTERAVELREGLKNVYSVIKDSDDDIRFCLLTGVSKFSKVSLFSGLNNLNDITLDPRYGDMCGYTAKELSRVFKDRLATIDQNQMKIWYNGYNFLNSPVYNPFSCLLYFDKKQIGNYWFETATPTFLVKLIKENKYFLPDMENLKAGEEILGSFDTDDLILETLLFQTGCLTIRKVEEPVPGTRYYTLQYPNKEVKTSLNIYLLNYLTDLKAKTGRVKMNLLKAIQRGDMDEFKKTISGMFAAIPFDWFRKNNLDKYEGYYASVTYACLVSLGFDIIAEDTTNHGRIDLTLFTEDKIYIFEFKVTELVKENGHALEQIKVKKYHEKYLDQSKPIYRIGMDFSQKERNLTHFEWDVVK